MNVSFNVMSDDVENDWTEVERASGQEGVDKYSSVHIMLRGPLSWQVVDESKILKLLMNQPMK